MARQLIETNLQSRAGRDRLTRGIYWRSLDEDVHLGYRRSARGGHWLVRWYKGQGKYQQATLALADDVISEGNLDFASAVRAAKAYVTEVRTVDACKTADAGKDDVPTPTVGEAVRDYVSARDARDSLRKGRTVRSDASYKMNKHVLADAELSSTKLADLTRARLTAWSKALPESLTPSARKRIHNDFRAALNAALEQHHETLPAGLAEVVRNGLKPGRDSLPGKVEVRENQILSDDLVRRLLEVARAMDEDGDNWRMLLVLAATGARFSQAARFKVGDVQDMLGRVMVPDSFKGKKDTVGHVPRALGQDVLSALRECTNGRLPEETLLERWRVRQVKVDEWEKYDRGPWKSSSELTRFWRKVVNEIGRPDLVMYCLRHSSIVRGLREIGNIRLVAALHDTSTAMIEKHYSRWIVDGLEELAARSVVPLVGAGG